ncbi:MAG: nucleotidyltransferase family protein, partial [Bacteroidales bacterium]
MNLIIPMAGYGTRLRPHTLTIPKPLLPIAGKPIVQHLIEILSKTSKTRFNEIGFIIGHFGEKVEEQLKDIARNVGATPKIYYQEKALGTAHAIYCAEPSLYDSVCVAFADTLFIEDNEFDFNSEGCIWVKKVENPESFGVVTLDNDGFINNFVEKPKQFVSD